MKANPTVAVVLAVAAAMCGIEVPRAHAQQTSSTLRALSDRELGTSVAIGVAAHGRSMDADPALRDIVAKEFAVVVPANEFKQAAVHPRPGAPWNWTAADRWIDRARAAGQTLRIHGPVGPQVSDWLKDDRRTVEELSAMLEAWIPALCQRYATKPEVRWIDVVNETIDIAGRWTGPREGVGLADNPWQLLGMTKVGDDEIPTYIVRSFELAGKHCGNLKLIINQHVITPPAAARLKQMVTALRGRGLRVDGIGWQAHVDVGWEKRPGRMQWFTSLVDWAQSERLEFHVTENNVYRDPRDAVLDERAQSETFAAILRVLLERRARGFVGWTLWHARDDQTDEKARTGCLWDNNNRPKLAYVAVRDLLSAPPATLAPPR